MATTNAGPTTADMYAVFQSIDTTLKHMLGLMEARTPTTGTGAPAVASDADLDGQYGNPEVKAKSPRDWVGESQQGKRFSECPPEYLDLVASRLDYFAQQNAASENDDDRKKVRFNKLDAARARGWAARLRAGWVAPVAAPTPAGNPFGDDSIAF